MRANLTWLDLVTFVAVLLLTVGVVAYGHRRRAANAQTNTKNSFLDYLLMGRQLTLPLFVATLVATWYGGIFGVTRIAFESGIYNFVTQGLFWYGTYLVFAFFLVGRVRAFKAVTLPELVGKMYGPKSA